MSTSNVIEIDHLTKYYGTREIVRDLSLKVPTGSIYGFLGRNGMGKTTTIRILLGLEDPTRGRPSVFGEDSRHLSPETRARIGYLPEEFAYVCLQKDIRDRDRNTLNACARIATVESHLRSFSDTAALLETLDLIIAVDTSVAHLSGAMGKKTWILLCYLPDWRYLLDRRDSPWYPTATLYRQPVAGDWESVFAEVKKDLLLMSR